MKYTVMTPDGLSMAFVDTLAPGGAAKLAVEEGKVRPGRVLVSSELGQRTVWDVYERRIVYAYEVRNG